jgi:hypothetical protein
MTDLTTLRHADPGTGEILDAIERLIDAGRIEEVDEILAEREAALRNSCKQRTGEILDAIERLIDAGRIEEVDEILAEREAALRNSCKQRRTWRMWGGARESV